MSRVDDMPGFLASLTAAVIMTAIATWQGVSPLIQTNAAICSSLTTIPLPGEWLFSLSGILLLWIVAAYTTNVNRRFNVEEGTSALPSSFFVIATASVPGFLTGVTPGVLMAMATIISLRWMFSCIDREQKAQPMFLAGTIISFGSMTEYAFIFTAIAIAAGAARLDLFDIRSVAGYIFGLITPYLLVLGFGIEAPEALAFTAFSKPAVDVNYSVVIAAGVTALAAIMLMLHSAVTPSHRSSRGIALNRTINIVLFILIVAMVIDMRNFTAYVPTIALLTGFDVAGLTGNRSSNQNQTLVIALLVIIYIVLFILSL